MKPRIIKTIGNLDPELYAMLQEKFPLGYENHLISFTEKAGKYCKAIPFETEEHSYLIKIDEAQELVTESINDAEEDLEEASHMLDIIYEEKESENREDIHNYDDLFDEDAL